MASIWVPASRVGVGGDRGRCCDAIVVGWKGGYAGPIGQRGRECLQSVRYLTSRVRAVGVERVRG